MCGIAGVISTGDPTRSRIAVGKMMRALTHRGPDRSGDVVLPLTNDDRHIVFGHTRLAIIDLSVRSDQPMCDAASGSWLVYNGEIYNYRELRDELESLGVRFHSSGDTEVLLKVLVQWGEAALRRLQGMFAFAFWDGRKRELLLARDQLGIKPLYIVTKQGLLMFASEVQAIKSSELVELSVSEKSAYSVLRYGAVIGPETIYKEVTEVSPGCFIKSSSRLQSVSEQEYWSLTKEVTSLQREVGSERETESLVKQSLVDSVRSHLVSDVPTGVFLSGGVDSSIIALLAAKHRISDLTLLTVGFPQEEFSEVGEAEIIARRAQCRHKVIDVRPEIMADFLPSALAAVDQPTVDGINTFLISRVAASMGLRVLLSGLGGDELFGGYTTFRKAPLLSRWGKGLSQVALLMRWLDRKNPEQWEKILALNGSASTLAGAYLTQRNIYWEDSTNICNLPTDQALSKTLQLGIEGLTDDFQRVAAMEVLFYMRNQLLRDADVFSMASSVELRVPFLDLRVVVAALSLPKSYHMGLMGGKKITRRILADLTGGAHQSRAKRGFMLPWNIWLRGFLKEQVADTLLNSNSYASLGLEAQLGRRLLTAFSRNNHSASWSQLWSLFVLLNWQEHAKCPHPAVAPPPPNICIPS